MASNTATVMSSTYASSDPSTPNTTFVQADPSTFRQVVQKLTGASEDPSVHKLPLTLPSRLTSQTNKQTTIPPPPTLSPTSEMGRPKRPTFKLHERRHAAKKFELNIGITEKLHCASFSPSYNHSPSSPSSCYVRNRGGVPGFVGFGSEMVMPSPVSPLELLARGSPRTPRSPQEEEERVIAEKGFYLHPSPRTPRKSEPPELLTLFPLHSPRHNQTN